MSDQRGGIVLKTGKIGRVNVLRQQLIAPGEMINTQIDGDVKIEATRERESLRINGHLATFLTPVRWLDDNWTTYITEGEDTGVSLATQSRDKLSNIGIGADDPLGTTVHRFWLEAVLRIYNEWYKWPEDADITTWAGDGQKAVPLQAAWNRCRYDVTPGDASDYQAAVVSNNLDVRTLAETQAKFRSAMEREILSYGRYMEMIGEMFGADGSREVDKVPMMIDQTEVGVSPRELPATDSAGLGDWQSIYDFQVDHRIGGIVAPEHCVLTYMLLMRFSPVIEGRNPLSVDDMEWADMVGDPEILRNKMPQDVRVKDVVTSSSTTSLGYLPAGWRWKTGWDVVGTRIDESDSFPMMDFPTTQAEAKDATRIKDAFRSQAFGDYIVDLHFKEESRNLHGSALESYFSGMTGAGSDAEFPKQGKML